MALKQRPPQHRVDASIIWVHPRDEAWDTERIRREKDELEAQKKDESDHPIARYLSGETRFDLDARMTFGDKVVTAREYLRPEEAPTLWYLNRLSAKDAYEAEAQFNTEVFGQGNPIPIRTYLWCCLRGVKKVENGPDLEGAGGKGKLLRDSDLEKLRSLDEQLPVLLGQAVMEASKPLREDEKKV